MKLLVFYGCIVIITTTYKEKEVSYHTQLLQK